MPRSRIRPRSRATEFRRRPGRAIRPPRPDPPWRRSGAATIHPARGWTYPGCWSDTGPRRPRWCRSRCSGPTDRRQRLPSAGSPETRRPLHRPLPERPTAVLSFMEANRWQEPTARPRVPAHRDPERVERHGSNERGSRLARPGTLPGDPVDAARGRRQDSRLVRPHGNVLVGLAGRAIGKRDRVIPTPDPPRTFRRTRLGHSMPHRAGLG
jgi:hypothetical protein